MKKRISHKYTQHNVAGIDLGIDSLDISRKEGTENREQGTGGSN